MMSSRGWLKTAGVAAGGGAVTALITGLIERERLGIYFGSGRLVAMVVTGAVTAVGGLLMRSPIAKQSTPADPWPPAPPIEAPKPDFRPPSGPG